ncbi:protein TIFY 6B isoform X2 [Jatropha curcas]|uniref:protein TIFY 6B isoform X2 n=1 Tax=Jatropha curcas TaxID=180498 RepID=UPI0005FAEEDB|nr:protein TIFY 6B isoform X2 [Jatropha curcas]
MDRVHITGAISIRGSAMQWSFSNKGSSIPQILSFKDGVEEKPRKSINDPLASSGFTSISIADAFDSNHKPYSSMVQKNVNLDKQGANHYAMTSYGVKQFGAYSVHQPQQMRIFPVANQQNQTITVSLSSPVLQSHFASTGKNVNNSQSLGGVPIISPVSVHPAPSSIVGSTDLRNGSKSSVAPAQMTIFYAGSVCVYDDISPEKAQAIMLLAGNGSSVTHNKTLSPVPMQASTRPSAAEPSVGNKTHSTSPCSGLPSPISMTSTTTSELATLKPAVALASANNQAERPKAVISVGPGSATLVPTVAVPQARKASLARFLEKRKERVMNTSPYNVSKKSTDSSAH